MASSNDDQMKMMLEDFNKLQSQLIDLRTQNYEIETKLRRSEAENSSVQEKCVQQEKEIQKLNKLMKFPGFQAITKSKSKKDMVELIEENERLNQQMQRHEDDFKLQNHTLLMEVSRLSSENDDLQNQLSALKNSSEGMEDYQRLEAENSVLKKTVEEFKVKSDITPNYHTDGIASNDLTSQTIDVEIDNLQTRLISELLVLTNTFSTLKKETDSNTTPVINNHEETKNDNREIQNGNRTIQNDVEIQNNSGELIHKEGVEIERTNLVSNNTDERDKDLKNTLEKYFNELKASLSSCTVENSSCLSQDSNIEAEAALQETTKLRQQLTSIKESSKKEVQQLREEVAKWSEKAKKKQESFLKLQEEKEQMYKEYRKEVDMLKDTSASTEENLKSEIQKLEESLKNSQNDDRTADLLEQLNMLSKENESLQTEVSSWREKQMTDHSARLAELEGRLHDLESEKESLIHQIEKLNLMTDEYESKNHSLHKEVEELHMGVERNIKLAESRKNLLDRNALDRQQDIEIHQKKMEGVKERHNNEMGELVGQKNTEIEDFKSQIVNIKKSKKEMDEQNKKFKKELDESKEINLVLNDKLSSLVKKSDWLERTLNEEQENCKNQLEKHEQQINEMTNTFLKEKDEQETIYRTEKQELEKAVKTSKTIQQEVESLVEKLKQTAKDHEIELAIGKKKNDQLIKDLKRQLTTERKRADQLSTKLQDFIQEVKVKQTYDEIFNPESLQMKLASSHRRQDSGSHISNVSSVNENEDTRSMKTSSPVDSTSNLSATAPNLNLSGMPHNISGLSDETMDLISRYADLQQEKWMLEERVRHLEETGACMADDVMQKSLIIQHYVMEKKADTPPSSRKAQTLKEKMMDKLKQIGTEELSREMNNKMQRILEETLATNVQLQKDLDLVTAENEQLKTSTNSS